MSLLTLAIDLGGALHPAKGPGERVVVTEFGRGERLSQGLA